MFKQTNIYCLRISACVSESVMGPRIPVITFLLCLTLAFGAAVAREYKGAEYRTIDSYLYGRFEVRYKAPAGSGMLASFFTYHEIESLSDWNEIDFEILGRYDHIIQVTTIGPARATRNSHQWVPFNTHDDFHEYAFEWTPAYIAWFVDGVEIHRQDGDHISDFNRPQKIMMNIWPPNAENWAGTWNEAILPVFAYYDYVRYASYTPGTGSTGTDNSFTPQWSDEFDDWDQGRWEKATHTFEGNNCDFVPENAVFQNGLLILCLTTADQTGYVDLRPPKVLYAFAETKHITLYFSETLETTSAESVKSYYINGITIEQAKLRADKKTVDLFVSELNPRMKYGLSVLGVMDDSPNQNKLLGQVIQIETTQLLFSLFNINLGPGDLSGFWPDQAWNPSLVYGYEDGYEDSISASIDIGGTDLDSVYRSARREVVGYKIRVPKGVYRVKFLMAEGNESVIDNPRLFNIIAEETRIADSVNIYQQAGMYQAYDILSPDLEVTDGLLDIHFTNLTDHSLISGLVIEHLSTGIHNEIQKQPADFQLLQNFPNPFNASTTIAFNLKRSGSVTLTIYDICGRQITDWPEKYMSAGSHKIRWDAAETSGVYFCHLCVQTDGRIQEDTRKMLLIR